ncbi:MAG: ATP-binding cassette domain-containing protein [Planctomycetes bacterium]|nr:ATP-binding cassette domain-containing protein [Planctomycetota bacterium]
MRARTTFFRDLALAAGRDIPQRTVEAAVESLGAGLDPSAAADASLLRALTGFGHRLGLAIRAVRAHLAEAVALAEPGHPVLLVLRRDAGHELVVVQAQDGLTARVDAVRGDTHERRTVSRGDFANDAGIDPADVMFACQVGVMGARPERETTPSLQGKPLRRLWQFLAPDRPAILLVVAFAAAVGVLTLVTPVAVQTLVNFVAFGGLVQPLIVLGILMFFTLAFAGAIRAFKAFVVEILQRRVFVRVVSDLSARLPRVRLDAYDRGYGPELVNRFFDVMTVQKAGASLLIDGLDIVLQTGIGLLVLGFYHPFLLVFDILLIAAIAVILAVVGRGAIRTAMKESKAKYAVAGALEELARAPVTYKLFGAPELARAHLAGLTEQYVLSRRKHFRIVFRQRIGAIVLHAIASTALLTLGGLLVIQGQLTLGQLIAAELIVSVALTSFVKFGKQLEAYYDMLAGVDKLGVLYDLPLEEDAGESLAAVGRAAALEMRGVGYAYPDHPAVIRDLDLRIEPGRRVALCGPRGAGKSTVAELLTGLREPTAGIVLFDGIDVRDIANSSIRFHMNLVKGFEIVSGSILENVRLGRSEVTIDEVRDALGRFGILDELMALPDGLRTEIGYEGAPLSRGTARLLMLARAIVGRPRAIVVDGILDNLDDASARRALATLAGSEASWTLVLLTAREDLCEGFDEVHTLAASAREPQLVLEGLGEDC